MFSMPQEELTIIERLTFYKDIIAAISSKEEPGTIEQFYRTFKDCLSHILDFLLNYGWHILFIFLLLILLWSKSVRLKLFRWVKKTWQLHDRHLAKRRQIAMEIARKKMQEHHDAQVAAYQKKLKEKSAKLLSITESTKTVNSLVKQQHSSLCDLTISPSVIEPSLGGFTDITS